MSGLDYESEYNNRARVPEHPEIIAGWQRDAAAFRDAANGQLDISYELSPRATFDFFTPEGGLEGARAVALFIHGGYWQAFDSKYFSHMAAGPIARGLPVAVANYDLCPAVRVGDIVEEMRSLVGVLWERYRKPVLAYGHSAGGHLTAALLATDWTKRGLPPLLVPAGLALSGLFDLQPLIETTVNEKLGMDRAEAIALSPIAMSAPRGTELIAAVGGAESSEYLRQSRVIADIWGRGGVTTHLDIRSDDNHFTVIGPLTSPDSDLTKSLAALA
ncbi:alpha/beta hydrolase fold domain-containing protein [Stappia sp. GBMRC 2046]|uniref:Alpha/beta hydrolase fold domain-containing protein n=1 Tax=Stappia sediminis TaxID=2692190 RepID=A0A7X3LVA6_9HYPH|nr:alpha/beta hydrolase [Stappia sediminis]MXN65680.1 alpha/beta hydrolase fold domain-containing protein [Stappia sediminis]